MLHTADDVFVSASLDLWVCRRDIHPDRTHTSTDSCLCDVNHELLPPRNSLGQADDYIKRMDSPSVTMSAKCPVRSLTPARFVIIPIHIFSLYCTFITLGLTHSESVAFVTVLKSSPVSFSFLKNPTNSSVTLLRFSKAHLSRPRIIILSHSIIHRTSVAGYYAFVCSALQYRSNCTSMKDKIH